MDKKYMTKEELCFMECINIDTNIVNDYQELMRSQSKPITLEGFKKYNEYRKSIREFIELENNYKRLIMHIEELKEHLKVI